MLKDTLIPPLSNQLRDAQLSTHLARLPHAWQQCLDTDPMRHAIAQLSAMLQTRLSQGAVIYPTHPFRAFESLQPDTVKVVILGQDPYHGPGQAQGFAFSVPDGVKRPPSLRNIFQEIARDYPNDPSTNAPFTLACSPVTDKNDLSNWAQQGVLLLNTSLTVEDGQPAAHARSGWKKVTDTLLAEVARASSPKVFMLWGAHAQAKQMLLAQHDKHLLLMANHPSPLAAHRPPTPFVGCGHFRLANDFLRHHNLQGIDWKA